MEKGPSQTESEAQRSDDLCGFLTRLATEPETLAAYYRDPGEVTAAAKLSKKARRALASGDVAQIHAFVATPSPAPENEPVSGLDGAASAEEVAARGGAAAGWPQQHDYQSYLWWLWANSAIRPQSGPAGSS